MSSIKEYPSVTITMITLNDEKIITDCLKSIKMQQYPRKIHILIIDGGSKDKTVEIAKRFGAIVISRPDLKNKPYIRGEIASRSVESEIALVLSADNRFKEKNCLKAMIEPFFDKEISMTETFRYGFNDDNTLLTKYFALIGGTDPIAVALGKADRAPYDVDKWHSFGKVDNKKNYFKVAFENDTAKIPTLGANGFAIRNSLLRQFPCKNSLHIEMCVDMIQANYNKFAFVRDVHIIHNLDSGMLVFLKRKLLWMSMYSDKYIKRKYLVFNPRQDMLKIIPIIISCATFIIPLLRAVKGYIKYKNLAWFLHPFMCFIFLCIHSLATIKKLALDNYS